MLKPAVGASAIRIVFRNVMPEHLELPIDDCLPPAAMLNHFESYRWFYALTTDPGVPRCLPIPCCTTCAQASPKCPNPVLDPP